VTTRTALKVVALILVAAAAGGLVTLIVYKRMATGEWSMPTGDDLIRVKRAMVPEPEGPPRVIYLHRGPIDLTGGDDDAASNRSSIVASFGQAQVHLPGFNGSDRAWKKIADCVRQKFAPFQITVTEQRPDAGNYILVAVGGKPSDAGIDKPVGGLAPFSGHVVPRAVVLVFSRKLGNRTRETCDVVGMEVAHAYGLDHTYECRDVMTYRPYCGSKRFVDKDMPCGESKKRACASGNPTQNSFRMLADALGEARPATPAKPPANK